MKWRSEIKYLIDEATFQQLYFTLRPILHADRFAKGRERDGFFSYHIRSLYFDDIGRSGVFDKMTGADPRHKYRIRIYNQEDRMIRLEKKIKKGRMVHKVSAPLQKDQVDALLSGQPESLMEPYWSGDGKNSKKALPLPAEFFTQLRTKLMQPMLLVDYERLPLTWPDGNVRITFDRFLSTGFYRQDLWDEGAAMMPVLQPGEVVLEVKFDRFLPDFIRHLLPLAGASPLSISKYVLCAGHCRQENWEDQM